MRKGTKGTHYKLAEERRSRIMTIKLTDAEYAIIKGKAAASGETPSEWVRGGVLAKKVPGYKPDDPQLRGQISIMDMEGEAR